MTELAEILEPQLEPIRRFYIADMTDKGQWVLDRILKAYPNQNQRSAIGWLNGIIDQNENLCLSMGPPGEAPRAVCFAERYCTDRLAGKMVVREVFVWVQDPENALLVQHASEFYLHMVDWAKHQGIEKVIVCERSDVPITAVREKFGGKLHEFKTHFARV